MEKEINLSMFIVPNQGCRLDQLIIHDEERNLSSFGVPFKPNSKCLQVWIHGEGEDNLTDHGLGDRICDLLGIPNDLKERMYLRAPGMFPVEELEKVQEGDTLTYNVNGCTVNIKCEQLPYRYGRFGRFEEVVEMISRRSDENIKWLDEMENKRAEKKGA